MKKFTIPTILLLLSITVIAAVFTEPQLLPSKTGYTLQDIDELITNNTTSSADYGNLSTTSIPSYSNNPSISTIYTKLFNLINPDNLKPGVTYLGVTGGQARSATTTVPTSSFHPTDDIQAQGYTLQDLYNLVNNSTTNTEGNHSLSTTSVPQSSMYSLTDLYNDLTALISPGNIKRGVTYLGIEGTYANLGTALGFDGVNELASVLMIDPDNYNSGLSFGGWIKTTSYPQDGVAVFAGWEPNGDWGITSLSIGSNGELNLRFACGNSSCNHITGYTVPLNEWVFIFATHDTSFDRVYINGSLYAEYDSGVLSNSSADFSFGQILGDTAFGGLFGGYLDEFSVWSRALSGSEITQLYNGGYGLYGDTNISPFSNGLIAGYHFDEGSGNIITDFSSNNYDGGLNVGENCSIYYDPIECENLGCEWVTDGSSADYFCTSPSSGNYQDGIVEIPQ